MIGKVIEGRYTGASVNKLPDKNFLFIETEDGERIALSKKNLISIEDVTEKYPSYGKKVMMVLWNDFETSIYQIGYSEEPRVQVNEITQLGEIQETSSHRMSKKKRISFVGVLAIVAAILVLAIACSFLLKPSSTKDQNETAEVQSTEQSEAIETAAPQNSEPPETVKTVTPEEIAYTAAEKLVAEGKTAEAALAFGKLGDYADARERSLRQWHSLRKRKTIAQANSDLYEKVFLGIKENGTVVAQGVNLHGECTVDDWSNIIEVYTNGYISFGLRKDGTIAMSDVTAFLQTDEGLKFDFRKKVSTIQTWTSMETLYVSEQNEREIWGLTTDGTVYYAGNSEGKPYLPEISTWTDIVGFYDCNRGHDWDAMVLRENYLGLRIDGTVVHAGENEDLKRAVESWHDIVRIKQVSIDGFVVGWQADGTMVSYGGPNTITQEDLLDVVDIVGSDWMGYALLKRDGTVATCSGSNHTFTEAENWQDIQSIYYYFHLIGVKSDGTVLTERGSEYQTLSPKSEEWTDIADVVASDISFGLKDDGTVCVSENRYVYGLKPWAGIRLPGYEEVTPPETIADIPEENPNRESMTFPDRKEDSEQIISTLLDDAGNLLKADEFIELYETIAGTAYLSYYGELLSIEKITGSQMSNNYGFYIDGNASSTTIGFSYGGNDTLADGTFDQINIMHYSGSSDESASAFFFISTLMSMATPSVGTVWDSVDIVGDMLNQVANSGSTATYEVDGVVYTMGVVSLGGNNLMTFAVNIKNAYFLR